MKQELVDFKDVTSSLQLLSKKVVPIKQRKSKLKSKLAIQPVCSYKNMQVSIGGYSYQVLQYVYKLHRSLKVNYFQYILNHCLGI